MRHVDNHARADMVETWLDETTVLLRDTWRRTYIESYTVDHWWLVVDGIAVAYLHTMTYLDRSSHQFILCDIEVRQTHRRHGYARRIIEAANDQQDDTLHTSGGFTPLGIRALAFVPLLPGTEPGIHYDNMPFVADWDNLAPVNPL